MHTGEAAAACAGGVLVELPDGERADGVAAVGADAAPAYAHTYVCNVRKVM